MILRFSVCAFGAKIKIINYLNLIKIPQKPDFAESEESDNKTKKQTQFVLSKKSTFRACDARFHLATESLCSLQVLLRRRSKAVCFDFFKISHLTLAPPFSSKQRFDEFSPAALF